MTRFIEFLISLLIVVVVFVVIGLFLPSKRIYSYSIETNRPMSTVSDLFNGFSRFKDWNPLLRYDAYYILADLIEVPNLARQSARYWGYLGERYLLRMRDMVSPAETTAERWWYGVYGLLSAIYRLIVTLAMWIFRVKLSDIAK